MTRLAPTTDPRLDWRPRHDPRSRLFDVADRTDPALPTGLRLLPVTRPRLLQGAEGACAGFASAHAANTHRLEANTVGRDGLLDEDDARALYHRAQQLDRVPGEDYSGTSILAAMLAGREHGLWAEFWWAFGTADIARALDQLRRPVVVGVPWTDGMYRTDPEGRVKIEGPTVGGHALEVVGFDPTCALFDGRPGFAWLNSHADYGLDGIGWLEARQLGWLLAGRGEAAVPGATS